MRGDGAAAGACLPSGHPRVLLVARREVVGLDRTGMPSCPGAANETSPPRPSFPEGSILPPPPGGFSRSKEPARRTERETPPCLLFGVRGLTPLWYPRATAPTHAA